MEDVVAIVLAVCTRISQMRRNAPSNRSHATQTEPKEQSTFRNWIVRKRADFALAPRDEGGTSMDMHSLPQTITAIGGLGTAAFGLVDATKALGGGVNHIGFGGIKTLIRSLTPGDPVNALSQGKIISTLQANWFNGTDLNSQKAIAKSLIKLNLNPDNAADLAKATGVDSPILTAIAANIAASKPLDITQSDVYARFDLILTALLDETYQRADDTYRNWTRAIAGIVAIVLAIVGNATLASPLRISAAVLVGLLATPLAPIAKDLSTALATAVNTLQLVKK